MNYKLIIFLLIASSAHVMHGAAAAPQPPKYTDKEIITVFKIWHDKRHLIKGCKQQAQGNAYFVNEVKNNGPLALFDGTEKTVETFYVEDNKQRTVKLSYDNFGRVVFDSNKIAAAAKPEPTLSQSFGAFWDNLFPSDDEK